jgi:hypothetical protein
VIRFSAGLVTFAIGVLIGGAATSKLLLVYIAILVSAVALISLAIGVVLKREELFGERQGLVTAAAVASPGLPVSAGDKQESSRNGRVTSPPSPFPGTAAVPDSWQLDSREPDHREPDSARPAYGRYAYGAPSHGAGAHREPPQSPGQNADDQPTQPTQPSWAAASEATSGGATVSGEDTRSSWSAPPADDAQASSWHPVPSFTPAAGGSAPPSWFDRPRTPPADAGGPPARSWERPVPPVDAAAAADRDDHWPIRYAWLDDEEPGEPAQATLAADSSAADPDVGDGQADRDDAADGNWNEDQEEHQAPQAQAQRDEAADDTPADVTSAFEANVTGGPRDGAAVADVDDVSPADTLPIAAQDLAHETDLAPEPRRNADEADAPDGTPDDELTGDEPADDTPARSGRPGSAKLFVVVPGVPRYHDANCILIRFMAEDDVQKVTVAEAKDTGCTPCAACQPEDT